MELDPSLADLLESAKNSIQTIIIDSKHGDKIKSYTKALASDIVDNAKKLEDIIKSLVSMINSRTTVETAIQNAMQSLVNNKLTPSYSNILSKQPPRIPIAPKSDEQESFVVMVNNRDKNVAIDRTRLLVKSKLKQCKNKSVNRVITTKKGFFLKVSTKAEQTELLTKLQSYTDVTNLCEVYVPTSLQPTVLIKFIDNDVELPELINEIIYSNPELKEHKTGFKFLFSKHFRNFQNSAFRVTPAIYQFFKKNNFKVPIGSSLCQVQTKIFVRQCQHCFDFGHPSSKCQTKVQVCPHCESTEPKHKCAVPEQFSCRNCHNHPKHKTSPTNHRINSLDCPLYNAMYQSALNRTRYTVDGEPPG